MQGFRGAYFANWKASKMVIPYGEVGANWWDAHFLSLDYGFGKSSASAHLHVRTQDGRIKTVGEFVAPHLPAYEFAGEVVRRFVAPQTDKGNRRRIVAVYLDPATQTTELDFRGIVPKGQQILNLQTLDRVFLHTLD